MTTFVHKQERKNIHVSRYVALDAFAAFWQILLARDPGSADLGFGTPFQFKGWADAILQARAFLPSRYTASSAFPNGDPPPALCTWRNRCSHLRADARAAGVLKWAAPAVALWEVKVCTQHP